MTCKENNSSTETEYIKNTFFEKFKSCSAVYKLKRNWNNMRTLDLFYSPIRRPNLKNLLRNTGNIYKLCPVVNGITHLIWFDINAHDKIDPQETFNAAKSIYSFLFEHDLKPELSQSSRGGNYHIVCWFRRPQRTGYCKRVQSHVLNKLKLNCEWIEFGPKYNLGIRPFHFISIPVKDENREIRILDQVFLNETEWKFGSSLIIRGEMGSDLSAYKDVVNEEKPKKAYTNNTVNQEKSLDLSNYIPCGGDTNRKLLRLCRDYKNCGYSDDKIIQLATEIHKRGQCKRTLPQHIRQCMSILKTTKTKQINKINNKKFWDTIEKDLCDKELFSRLSQWTKENSRFDSFCLPCREYGFYRLISPEGARKRLRKYEQTGLLKLFERGCARRSTKYTM